MYQRKTVISSRFVCLQDICFDTCPGNRNVGIRYNDMYCMNTETIHMYLRITLIVCVLWGWFVTGVWKWRKVWQWIMNSNSLVTVCTHVIDAYLTTDNTAVRCTLSVVRAIQPGCKPSKAYLGLYRAIGQPCQWAIMADCFHYHSLLLIHSCLDLTSVLLLL